MKQNNLVGLVLIVAFIGGIWAAINVAPPATNISTEATDAEYFQHYPAARALPEFSLYTADDKELTSSDLQNQWTLVFLGYTFCPDICPATMAALSRVYPELQKIDSEYPIKVLFLSVDPKRDTPQRLSSYKTHFNDAFIAASGPHNQLFPLVRSFGLMYSMPESTDQSDYLVDHSGSVVLVGPDAEVIGRFKPQAEPGQLSIANPAHILSDLPGIVATKS
ncbi:SCO family protein [Salinimonas chungwhensis]|uniref:SCO family protein n=1 Tax=Salinimonas chungwhensis TaxID=265425 RepID=UPI00035D08B2|nr:SCO family protein [Salinimonas chungwhensis]